MKDTKTMFLESYNLYSDEVFRFALFKLSDREKAKDVAQEAFMKMWLYLSKGNEIKNARAFLYKIAGNSIVKRVLVEYMRILFKDYINI